MKEKNEEVKKLFLKFLVKRDEKGMVAIASDESVDRMGDSLKVDSWDLKNFKKNPVLLLAHDYSQPPVGVAKKIGVENNKLMFEPVFHEITQTAREIKKMYEEGIMKAFSVGFLPRRKGEGEKASYTYELLEISAVPVPANANALMARGCCLDTKNISEWIVKEIVPDEAEKEKEGVGTETEKEGENDEPVSSGDELEEEKKEDEEEKEAIEVAPKEDEPKEEKPEEEKEDEPAKEEPEKEEEEKPEPVVEKEGRVISKKNRNIITDSITSLNKSVTALENLLDLQEGRGETVEESREPKVAKTSDKVLLRALQKSAKNMNFALNRIKKEN